MIRAFLLSCFIVGFLAGSAHGAVYYNGHRVTASLVGGIDANPCNDPTGCVRGVVEVRFHGRHGLHLVLCGHPRHLHVMGVFRENGVRHVAVWACRRAYDWRLP